MNSFVIRGDLLKSKSNRALLKNELAILVLISVKSYGTKWINAYRKAFRKFSNLFNALSHDFSSYSNWFVS